MCEYPDSDPSKGEQIFATAATVFIVTMIFIIGFGWLHDVKNASNTECLQISNMTTDTEIKTGVR